MAGPTTAVIFTTDPGYLIPTLVATEQVQAQITPGDGCAILIFTLDLAQTELDELTGLFPPPSVSGAALPKSRA